MKKNLLGTILVSTALTIATTTGCGTSAPNAETETTTEIITEASTDTEKSENIVKSLYSLEKAEDALADGGYSVSFTADDLAKTDAGYELTAEVFEYDRYELDAINNLKEGSKIQFCDNEIAVDKVEKNSETGFIQINGGAENGGFDLTEDDGLYRTVTDNDYPVYYSVGRVTIPLSEEVTFEDQSKPETNVPVVELKDLPEAIKNSDTPFYCNNTVITVRGEKIVQIIRHMIP